ncbi:MAG: type II toxin-antitoxin system HicA family toxin [Patescibacteria group bacterium]
MPRLPRVKPREVIRALEKAGFVFIKQKGSHRIYVKGRLGVTVAYHNKDLKLKTLKHIIEQSGLELEEFIELL